MQTLAVSVCQAGITSEHNTAMDRMVTRSDEVKGLNGIASTFRHVIRYSTMLSGGL